VWYNVDISLLNNSYLLNGINLLQGGFVQWLIVSVAMVQVIWTRSRVRALPFSLFKGEAQSSVLNVTVLVPMSGMTLAVARINRRIKMELSLRGIILNMIAILNITVKKTTSTNTTSLDQPDLGGLAVIVRERKGTNA
jgi:hypothetical protein